MYACMYVIQQCTYVISYTCMHVPWKANKLLKIIINNIQIDTVYGCMNESMYVNIIICMYDYYVLVLNRNWNCIIFDVWW